MRIALTTALILALPVMATAEDDPIHKAVEARQGYFTMLGVNMGTLAGMARGQIAYDAETAAQAAANIEALTLYDVSIHFPAGSSADDLGSDVTEAKATIWGNMDQFQTLYADLGQAAMGAGEAVTAGADSIGPVVGALGGACKACHDEFRVK